MPSLRQPSLELARALGCQHRDRDHRLDPRAGHHDDHRAVRFGSRNGAVSIVAATVASLLAGFLAWRWRGDHAPEQIEHPWGPVVIGSLISLLMGGGAGRDLQSSTRAVVGPQIARDFEVDRK